MQNSIQAAAVQMKAEPDKAASIRRAFGLVREAAGKGAELIVLPELFNCIGKHRVIAENAEPIPGPTSEACGALAKELGVFLLAGSIGEKTSEGDVYNTSLLFGPNGVLRSQYRKIHLFDAEMSDGPNVRESGWITPGQSPCLAKTEVGYLGQAICYDLRFPELFRHLSAEGAEILVVPSAFTEMTGKAHWEPLLRARAIENQCFVIAPNQWGEPVPGIPLFGHSIIIDPWGRILAEAGDREEDAVVAAQLEARLLHDIRRQLPSLKHRRQPCFTTPPRSGSSPLQR